MEFSVANERAVRYIAASLKTEYEVRQKLQKIGCDNDIAEKVINHLKEISYIDDNKYIQAFIRQAMKMPKYSIFELEYKLKGKGIKSDLIEEFKNTIKDTSYELDLINKITAKKIKCGEDEIKIKNYLYRRGFNTNI